MIDVFVGPYHFLSNFYRCKVVHEGLLYKSAEAAYQAAKTTDKEIREGFQKIGPAAAKKIGRLLPLRDDWYDIRLDVMRDVLRSKFDLWGPPINDYSIESQWLVNTYPHELVERNSWNDTFWGVCNGVGENWLGKLLMNRRNELMALNVKPQTDCCVHGQKIYCDFCDDY